MNKSNINEQSAGTEADSDLTAQNQQVSQPNANTNVVGSRLIKFKSWDLAEKCFVKLNGISFHTNEAVVELFGINTIVDLSKLQLIQYTGLKDKNGKEIYEGDIVEADGSKTILFKDNSDARRFVSPIFKDEYKSYSGRFLFVVYWQSCFSQFSFNPLDPMVSIECNVNKRDFKIIGNIFENPELLQIVA